MTTLRKGDILASGFQVEPSVGATVVTGLTLTTANDVPGRDPASYELYGSNGTIAGPYELIASGDVVDFTQEVEWPRFTKNETPISFDNTVAYKYYQVLFPTIRGPAGGSVNSMQISEVELIGTSAGAAAGGPLIIWVSDAYDDNGDGVADDLPWVDLLEAEGYSVDYTMGDAPGNGYWRTLDDDKIAALNAADLIIVSRNTNSGDYNNGDEGTLWNSVTTPIILSSTHIVRSSRWKWLDTGSTDNAASAMMQAVDASNPLFAGVALDANGQVAAMTDKNCSFASIADAGNGTVVASRAGDGEIWIAEWDAGVEYYAGAGEFAGGRRMFFVAGTQEDAASGIGRGELNLTADGITVFLNAVKKLTTPPPLIASVVRSGGVSGDRDPIGPYDGSTAPLATEPGGLMDGNMVFSDRTYPWSGVPAEYVGSEYIRTFNSDKNGGTVDVTYEVTLSRPATVWITVDDRIPAEWDGGGTITSPQDAADRVTAAFAAPGTFVDTGIDLYVHENDTTDRSMSVYAAELDAGTYVFGSMDSGKNFYNIGAIE